MMFIVCLTVLCCAVVLGFFLESRGGNKKEAKSVNTWKPLCSIATFDRWKYGENGKYYCEFGRRTLEQALRELDDQVLSMHKASTLNKQTIKHDKVTYNVNNDGVLSSDSVIIGMTKERWLILREFVTIDESSTDVCDGRRYERTYRAWYAISCSPWPGN